MEHLLDPVERGARNLEVSLTPPIPWLGFDHDLTAKPIVSFEDYPLQRNWTREEISKLSHGEVPASRTPDESLAMIQSWMFFGLLESAFHTRFATHDYTRDTDGQVVMDTSELRVCIDNYYMFITANQDMEDVIRGQEDAFTDSLRHASFWTTQLAVFSASGDPLASNSEPFTHVCRLAVLVGEAVWAVGQQLPSQEPRFFIDCTWRLEPEYERQLKRRATDRGWCPAVFEKMNNFARLPASLLEYMSVTPCFKVAQTHHQDCQDRCEEYNVENPQEYQARHRLEGCACLNVRFDVQHVDNALKASAIAVVDTDELLRSNSDHCVIQWKPTSLTRFVAFSHVWSDGLGSDTERGLPACQVRYLRDWAMDAAGTSNIWIDSLCIPRDPELRKEALSRMSESYRSSYVTVVLDEGIRHCTTRDSPQAQLLAVSLSTWQERLWTLSESVLSRRVVFAFEDDLKSSKEILDVGSTLQRHPVVRIGCTLLDNLSHGMFSGDVTVGAVQRNLCRRASTWAEDESLAVAPLMGMDLSPLLAFEDGDERMACFWSLAARVPKSIILDTATKLEIEGFRWAPRSMMNSPCDVMWDFRDQSAAVTDHGLRARFSLHHLHFRGSLAWPPSSRPLTFFNATNGSCLTLGREHYTTSDPLLPGDVVCFPDRLQLSQSSLGALLRPVRSTGGVDGDTLPRYEYRTIVAANLSPIGEMTGSMGGILGSLFTGAVRMMGPMLLGAVEEETEIVIC